MNFDPMLLYILYGSLGAIGAALALGTGAALVRYYRTGTFPEARTREGEVLEAYVPTRAHLIGLWGRVVVGGAFAVWAVVTISRSGIL
jgi:hypothetical protein